MSLLIACLADDFTGATDAVESLSLAGLHTMMFAKVPSLAEVNAIPRLQAIVVASSARSWVAQEAVRPMLTAIRNLKPQHVVYKVCSTFDSSPQRGNIGRVIEIGADVFDQAIVPVVPGAPALGRYVVFGNLFAAESIAAGGDLAFAIPAGAPGGSQFLSQKSLTEAKDDLYLIHRPSQPYSEVPAHYRAIDRRARMPLHWSSVQAGILLNEEPIGVRIPLRTKECPQAARAGREHADSRH